MEENLLKSLRSWNSNSSGEKEKINYIVCQIGINAMESNGKWGIGQQEVTILSGVLRGSFVFSVIRLFLRVK